MSKIRKEQIDCFLAPRKLAIAGASRNPQKFGHQIVNHLLANGYAVTPINPNADEILGLPCLKKVHELPGDIDSLLIVTPQSETDQILREAIQRGIKNIWVQQSAETADTLRIAEEYQREIITRKCIFMFAEPVSSIHKFHRGLVRLLGSLPK